MKLKTLRQVKNLKNKKVLVRVGFDVQIKNRRVVDDVRIHAVLPTIRYLIRQKAKVILISHLGRPDGRRIKKYSLEPVYENLKSKIPSLRFVNDCVGPHVKKIVDEIKPDDVVLLENLRFYPGEEKNSAKFSKQLASLGDIYINEVFSVCHRKHASINAITRYLPSYAGLLLQKEVKALSQVLQFPKHPFVVVMGGIKISTKIGAIKNLTKIANKILLGGALFNNFLKASGYNIGKSIYEPQMINITKKLLRNRKIILPVDVKVKSSDRVLVWEIQKLKKAGKDFEILDIGPQTLKVFSQYIKNAKIIVWNGPMGYFEDKRFSQGTRSTAQAILKNNKAKIIIGGGETISAIKKHRIKNNVFISTGGGAMLEFLSGKILPGIKPLLKQ